jgi:lipoate-protein ligase B
VTERASHDAAGAAVIAGAAGAPDRSCEWSWLGSVPYLQALALQEYLRARVAEGAAPDTLLLLEHGPVITLGRHANSAHVLESPQTLAERGITVVPTSRGGDVTFHGPGQLVGYPIFRLRHGIRTHVASMAGAIITVLSQLGLRATWNESRPGVWVGNDKICAIGVHVRRRVTVHGFALNVSIDPACFRAIVPCGLADAGVTSILQQIGSAPPMAELAERVAGAFAGWFGAGMVPISPGSSRLQIPKGDR